MIQGRLSASSSADELTNSIQQKQPSNFVITENSTDHLSQNKMTPSDLIQKPKLHHYKLDDLAEQFNLPTEMDLMHKEISTKMSESSRQLLTERSKERIFIIQYVRNQYDNAKIIHSLLALYDAESKRFPIQDEILKKAAAKLCQIIWNSFQKHLRFMIKEKNIQQLRIFDYGTIVNFKNRFAAEKQIDYDSLFNVVRIGDSFSSVPNSKLDE